MDIAVIAEQAVLILTLLASKAEDAVVEKVVDAGIERGKQLYQAVVQRFKQEDDKGRALKVFENFEDDPEEYTINLENKLLDVMRQDPVFANQLLTIIQQGPLLEVSADKNSSASRNRLRDTTGRGTLRITATDQSKADDNILESN